MASDKEYYHILDVDQKAAPTEIKRAYRRLAFKYHPDRNPGDAEAEERFKLISEAYAVLIDPVKRAQYDRARTADRTGPRPGFTYTREDIFRDAHANQVFNDIRREFERFGFRFDDQLMNRLFFGRQKAVFGGFVFFGPLFGRGPAGVMRDQARFSWDRKPGPSVHDGTQARPGALGRIGAFLKGKTRKILGAPDVQLTQTRDKDITYYLTIPKTEAETGTKVQVAYTRDGQPKKISVNIPPGVKDGTRLRIKNMGHQRPEGSGGDLFLYISLA